MTNAVDNLKQEKPSQDSSNAPEAVDGVFYEVIGECYVDYKMDGEACPRHEPLDWEENFTLI